MSRSNKARNGTHCKRWKDAVLESRSQKRAWAKRKQIKNQQDRARGKAETRSEIAAYGREPNMNVDHERAAWQTFWTTLQATVASFIGGAVNKQQVEAACINVLRQIAQMYELEGMLRWQFEITERLPGVFDARLFGPEPDEIMGNWQLTRISVAFQEMIETSQVVEDIAEAFGGRG